MCFRLERLQFGASVEVLGTAGIPFWRRGKMNLLAGDLETVGVGGSKGGFARETDVNR